MASTCIADGPVHKKTEVFKYESLDVFKEPRCLVAYDQDGNLQIQDDVLSEIKQIHLPLSVVTIAGPFRTGKSYLLNRLAGVKKGFKLGSTIKAETKGVWVWCRSHPIKDNQILLLMDTEGLGDIEKGDRNNDNHIFALAILLSNALIYNISGTFTAENVDKLAFVTEVSKLLKVPEGKHGLDMRSLALFSPLFILTLRDFTLELMLDEREITSDEYLEDFCLSLQPENNEKARMMNQTRHCLKTYFSKRKCFTFAPPGGPKILQKLEEFQDESLDQDFVEESKKFVDFVFKKTPHKEIENGQPINGERFAVLVRVYVQAIRTGKIPDAGDALKIVAEQENKKALQKCVEMYVASMTSSLTFPIPEKKLLSEANLKCGWEAITFFRSNSICDTEHSYLKKAHELIMSEYETIISKDEELSMQKSQKSLKELHAVIQKGNTLDRSTNGYDSYKKGIDTLKAKYDKLTGLGCKKNDALVIFINEQWTEAEKILRAEGVKTKKDAEEQLNRCIKEKDQELRKLQQEIDNNFWNRIARSWPWNVRMS
ncbi:hypothetical protein CHS0354_002523 [Potamilus streckersoni]|uniref:GB1/RHD3-type G domain-containing protein n=1 Tax=Potamilus streckersoni TaxID=2493646 RepID=A0AAE0W1L9_9BIVA|nr:hypothetical protein CHS0354_002523 [Potamilus streckersoni]